MNIGFATYSQNLDALEKKYGYKSIKLGMNKNDLPVKLWFDKTFIDGLETQIVNDSSYNYIGDEKIFDLVSLQFVDNRVYSIVLETTGEDRLKKLIEIFATTYGKDVTETKSSKTLNYTWKSANVILSLSVVMINEVDFKVICIFKSKEMFLLNIKRKANQAAKDL